MNDAVAQFRVGPHNTFVGMRAVGQLDTRCICCSTLQVPARAVSLGFVPDSCRHRTPSVSCGVVPGNEAISLAHLQLDVDPQNQQATSNSTASLWAAFYVQLDGNFLWHAATSAMVRRSTAAAAAAAAAASWVVGSGGALRCDGDRGCLLLRRLGCSKAAERRRAATTLRL